MVNPAAPTPASDESPAADQPGIRGYSPYATSPASTRPSTDVPPHPQDSHDAPAPAPTSELNSTLLRQRLLQAISPAAVDPRAHLRPTSSAPNLSRSDSLGASSTSHAAHSDSHAAHSDSHAAHFDKLRRTGTDLAFAHVDPASRAPSHLDAASCGGVGLASGPPPIAAVVEGTTTPRPPLLSKKLLEPKVPVGKNPSFKACVRNTVTHSWLNVLLVFVPVAWAMDLSHQSPTVTFVCSFFAIVPLAALLGFATEELALRVGDAFGGLLNATFGNAVELIIAVLALVKGELNVVRSSMLGSILSNCLLVMGGSFFAGGIRFHEQGYSIRAAQLNINLLGISVVAIVVPTAFHSFLEWNQTQSVNQTDTDVLQLSRGIAFILLFVYASYLVFQLWTHSYLYVPAHATTDPSKPLSPTAAMLLQYEGPQPPDGGRVFRIPSWGSSTTNSTASRSVRSRASSIAHPAGEDEESATGIPSATRLVATSTATDVDLEEARTVEDLEKQDVAPALGHGGLPPRVVEQPKLSVYFAFGLLLVITALTGVTAEFLVSSISGLTATGNISTEFVALILLPVVGNAAEHVTAITVATKNKLDLSLAVAVGSSIQIALFVVPVLVLLGWCIGQPLDLFFDPFETLLLFLCICGVNWAIADGRTNWLEGLTLMVVYLIIALTVWYYPGLPINA
ncbi:hypothetical protein JCM10212_006884 [Sporobolomyces blumeae]